MTVFKIIIVLIIFSHSYYGNYIEDFTLDNVAFRYIIEDNMKFGFADETGKIIIPPIYDSVSEFHNGLAWGYNSDNLTYYYFNTQGEVQCSFKLTMDGGWFIPGDYSDERIRVGTNFYDKNGNFIFGDYYYRHGLPEHEPSDFSEGLCVYPVLKKYEEISDSDFVEKFINYSEYGIVDNWEYVFRDKYGNIVLGPYNYARSFHNGYAKVKTTEGEYGFINKTGEFTKSEINGDFNNGLASYMVVEDGVVLYGFINEKNDIIILAEYDYVDDFKYGVCLVQKGSHRFFINVDNEVVFQLS